MRIVICCWHAIAIVLLCHGLAAAQEEKTKPGPTLGAINKGICYTSISEYEGTDWAYLYYADIEKALPQKTIRFPGNSHEPKQWHLAYGSLWVHSRGPSFGRENNNLLTFSLHELNQGKLRSKVGDHKEILIPFTTGDDPLLRIELFLAGPKGAKAFYDYVPVSENSAHLFLLTSINVTRLNVVPGVKLKPDGDDIRKWTFLAAKYKAAWGPSKKFKGAETWLMGEWSDAETMEVGFKEAFHAFAVGTDFYFVTVSGKLYLGEKPADGPRRFKALWDDPKRPITHVLSDEDRKRITVFGKEPDPKGGERAFFFPMNPQVMPGSFDPAKLPAVKAEEPLRTMLQYARAIADPKAAAKKSP